MTVTRTSARPREAALSAAGGRGVARGRCSSGSARRAQTSRRTPTSARCSSITASRSGTTSGTRAATASSPTASSTTRSPRCSGSGCSRSRPSRPRRSPSRSSSGASGGRPRAGRAGRSRSSGRASSSRRRSRSRSAPRWRCWRSGRCRRGARWRFAVLAALTLAASPLAFLLLTLLLAGFGIARWRRPARAARARADDRRLRRRSRSPLLRALPRPGQLPVLVAGAAGRARLLRPRAALVVARRAGAAAALDVRRLPRRRAWPRSRSRRAVGENVARLRYAAIPLAVLTLSLRRWRPLPVALVVLALAVSWNLTPLAVQLRQGARRPGLARAPTGRRRSASCATHLTPSYRVEAVDTTGHWAAVYLRARRSIPLARGWFRQDDFPQNELLYDDARPDGVRRLAPWRSASATSCSPTRRPTTAPAAEAALLRSGRSGLWRVLETPQLTIFAVPRPQPILTGAGARARASSSTATRCCRPAARPGDYRLAVRFSPYWRAPRRVPDPARGRYDDRLARTRPGRACSSRSTSALRARWRPSRDSAATRPRLRRRLGRSGSGASSRSSSRTTAAGLFSKRKSNSAKPATPLAARARRYSARQRSASSCGRPGRVAAEPGLEPEPRGEAGRRTSARASGGPAHRAAGGHDPRRRPRRRAWIAGEVGVLLADQVDRRRGSSIRQNALSSGVIGARRQHVGGLRPPDEAAQRPVAERGRPKVRPRSDAARQLAVGPARRLRRTRRRSRRAATCPRPRRPAACRGSAQPSSTLHAIARRASAGAAAGSSCGSGPARRLERGLRASSSFSGRCGRAAAAPRTSPAGCGTSARSGPAAARAPATASLSPTP